MEEIGREGRKSEKKWEKAGKSIEIAEKKGSVAFRGRKGRACVLRYVLK